MPAEIFPEEGLTLLLNIFPRGGSNLTTTYLALFVSQGPTSVISSNQTANNITEPDFGSYARQLVNAADWGAAAQSSPAGQGMRTTAAQKQFPTATANTTNGATNGFWLADILSSTGDKCIYQANFDDDTAVQINQNDIIKVTPTMQFNV